MSKKIELTDTEVVITEGNSITKIAINENNPYYVQLKEETNNFTENMMVVGEIELLQEQTGINLLQAKKESQIKQRIENGEITATKFNTLTPEEQELTKLVLFKQYSPTQVDIPKALSTAEFFFVPLFKFLDKTMNKSTLTVEEITAWNSLVAIINKSDMPINNNTDWRYTYADTEFTNVQNNRLAYFTEKQNVTGSI